MTVPTNISEPPMAHTKQKSLCGSKGKKHSFPMELYHHVFDTIVCITADDQLESLCHWISYRGFLNFDDLHKQYHHNPESINQEIDYKLNGVQKALSSNIIQKLTLFTYWMTKERECSISVLKDEFIQTLTREQFIEFRAGKPSPHNSKPPPDGSYTSMTTLTGHTKLPPPSESQIALINFKRGTKRDASAYPIFKNDLYYDTFQRSFLAIIKAQGLYDVANPDFEPDDVDQYAKEFIPRKPILCLLCTGYFSSDKRGES